MSFQIEINNIEKYEFLLRHMKFETSRQEMNILYYDRVPIFSL